MGIALLLLKRTFASRPKRTLLFLLGYALATGVMITLLAVGEAVLRQSRDKDLLGGGDLILVPQGIDVESIKVGGIAAMYHTIPQARFIVRQMLSSNRFKDRIDAVSPYLFSKLLYARKQNSTAVETLFAEGSIPDLEKRVKNWHLPWSNSDEDREWIAPSTEEFYHDIDRFHLPPSESLPLDQWAEWHYFNFEGNGFYGYLSFMAAGDLPAGKANWIVALQLVQDEKHQRYAFTTPASISDLPLERVEYRIDNNRIRFVKDHYEIDLDYKGTAAVRGSLQYYPQPNLYLPPAYLAKSENFESGYVIPSIRGKFQGAITVDGRIYDFSSANGYHDHNWGIWQQPDHGGEPVRWNWGHAFSGEYAIFFGEIFIGGKSKGLFAGVFDKSGYLTIFRPDEIKYSALTKSGDLMIPEELRFAQQKRFTAIQMEGKATSFVHSPVGENGSLHFVQYKMEYSVRLNIDGRQHNFSAKGNAETFVHR